MGRIYLLEFDAGTVPELLIDYIASWADMHDTANMEAKKTIVNCLIKQVAVYRNYKLLLDFNIDLERFNLGIDIVTIA